MSSLKNKLLFNCYYFLFWIGYFVFARLSFLIFYFKQTSELDFLTICKTFLYGLRLDASFAAYLSFLPFLIIIFKVFSNWKIIERFLKWYSFLLIIIISLLLILDLNLYQSWGTRLDTALLNYLNTPEVMIASTSNFQLIFGIISWGLISFIAFKLFLKFFKKSIKKIEKGMSVQALVLLCVFLFLIIIGRGGLQTIPINQSNVYFSNKMFANHAAVNFSWNFFSALTHKPDDKNPYVFFKNNTAKNIITKTRNKLLDKNTDSILNTNKPNVILIIWESLSAKAVGVLGGEPNITVNLDKLSKEGILFTNFYANGDRTDKGIPAILSGYYPQPKLSIMKQPNKSRSLPMLPKKMNELGYETSFYYGGDLNFANMNTYLHNAGITEFIDGNNFDKKDWNSKWGVHDHIFMKRFADDFNNVKTKPFFKIALTLTSHEPYEIIGDYKFGKRNDIQKFKSAHAYTDQVIGDFISFAKKQEWYKNTLIVIMSDHGHRFPLHKGVYNSPKKFKIPMLWLGGALNKTGIKIDNISSQVDFSYTLLDLVKGDNSKFKFSKHIFNNSKAQYAHYIFNNGFGIFDKKGLFVFDYTGNKPILEKGNSVKKLDSLGKAISQNAFQDFLDR